MMSENNQQDRPVYCRKCGHELIADSRFCMQCGEMVRTIAQDVGHNEPTAPEPLRKLRAGRAIAIAAVCFLALAGVGIGVYAAFFQQTPVAAPGSHDYAGRIGIFSSYAYGVKDDGTVLCTTNSDPESRFGQDAVSDWTDIVAISANTTHAAGLRKDGTVMAAGKNDAGQCDVSNWTDIVAIATGQGYTLGLKKDGTVLSTNSAECDVSGWKDIIAISSGLAHAIGLKSDGTVVAVEGRLGEWKTGQTDVSSWKDIVAIAAGAFQSYGLRKDGTVVATGITMKVAECGQGDVGDWKDVIALSATVNATVGLKKDGTVYVATNENSMHAAETWKDIVAVSVGMYNVIGLKKDGTVVSTPFASPKDDHGQGDVEQWNLFED